MNDGMTDKPLTERLRTAGLRPTRQRIALGSLMFEHGDRHFTAEMLHEEAVRDNIPVSLATVYNTLHQFTEARLIREIAVEGSKTYFDTNTSNHYHYFVESEGRLMDVESSESPLVKAPNPPEGYEITQIDVLVRLRRKSGV
jgi:Fur family iron response transcriptional regulator